MTNGCSVKINTSEKNRQVSNYQSHLIIVKIYKVLYINYFGDMIMLLLLCNLHVPHLPLPM